MGSLSTFSASGSCARQRRAQSACVGHLIIGRRPDRAPGCGPYRECELLQAAVPILYPPGHGSLFLFPEDPNLVAERREVGISADVYRMLRARLHARIALPAEVRSRCVRPPVGRIYVHDVGRADFHALAAAVTSRHVNESGHIDHLPNVAASAGRGRSDGRPPLPPSSGKPPWACRTYGGTWTRAPRQTAA